MKKTILLLMLLVATPLLSQVYNEDDKEDLRALMRQSTNWQKMGLAEADTLGWYENEEWVPKLRRGPVAVDTIVAWVDTDSGKRVSSIKLDMLNLNGKLKLRSPKIHNIFCVENLFNEIDVSECTELNNIDCSRNYYLRELDFSKNKYISWISADNNQLTKLIINENANLYFLSCRSNLLRELKVSKVSNRLSFQGNNMTFSTMPYLETPPDYGINYAPQATTRGGFFRWTDTIDLSSEYNIRGTITTFEWFNITSHKEESIAQPTNKNGFFTFTEAHADKKLRCKMRNDLYPDLIQIYETELIQETPQIYNEDDKEDLRALMRQGNNWQLFGLIESDTLTWYENEKWASKLGVNLPSYYPINWIDTDSGKRISGVNFNSVTGLTGKLKLRSPEIEDIHCIGPKLTEIDVSECTKLSGISCQVNQLTELDLSKNDSISTISVWGNQLTKLIISENAKLKTLECHSNQLTELKINPVSWSLTFYNNNMKLSTMPYLETPPKYFTYAPQATIEGGAFEWTDTIDLSSEYNIHGTITTFEWFDITSGTEANIAQPTNENGFFTFTEAHKDKKLRCKMKNWWYSALTIIYETELTQGIEETTISNLQISPNPANNAATLTLDLEKSGNLKIAIIDILGKEIVELHNNFEAVGVFSKTFSVATLPKGIYYVKIENSGNIKTEKFAVD